MNQRKIILVIGGLVLLFSLNNMAQCATLSAGEKIHLCRAGDGQWDVKIKKYEIPRGITVDNDGHIYVCDTLSDRILVFTAQGQPWQVIRNEYLSCPSDIKVSENNALFITGGVRGKGESTQFTVSYDGKSWIFRRLGKAEVVVAGVEKDSRYGEILPFGKDGLRYLVSTVPINVPLQLVDENNHYVKLVPSVFFDQKGRYYKSIPGKGAFGIYSESGKLLGKFTAGGPRLLKFRGWVYVIERLKGKQSVLRRYGENGSVEHEITVDAEILATPLISPNSEYFFLIRERYPGGIWIKRLTYHED